MSTEQLCFFNCFYTNVWVSKVQKNKYFFASCQFSKKCGRDRAIRRLARLWLTVRLIDMISTAMPFPRETDYSGNFMSMANKIGGNCVGLCGWCTHQTLIDKCNSAAGWWSTASMRENKTHAPIDFNQRHKFLCSHCRAWCPVQIFC